MTSLPRLIWLIALSLAALAAGRAGAWGTAHTEITRWAFRQLPAADRAAARLGGVRQMEDLCWGGDYQGEVMAAYYVDDYLLFPEFPRHSSHLMPEVAETWRPFFRRTLQALRGESPANAARWLGSLLHFVQDSGSPPHALPTGGVLHSRMENYVFNFDIRLSGYRPVLLGLDEAAAEAGLEERLRALVAYARERGERLRPLAERDDRRACEPLELECALESLRATADVTHTLLRLSEGGPRPGRAALRAEVRAPADPAFPLAPTKVLLFPKGGGPRAATVADARPQAPGAGAYAADAVLADLPPGAYEVAFLRPGCRTLRRPARLEAGQETRLGVRLARDPVPGNVVRNADLGVRWLRADLPDGWRPTGDGWRSDPFPLEPGMRYRLGARDAAGLRPVRLLQSDEGRFPAAAAAEPPDAAGAVTARLRYGELWVGGAALPAHAWVAPAAPAAKEGIGGSSGNGRG